MPTVLLMSLFQRKPVIGLTTMTTRFISRQSANVIPAINAVDGFNPADFVRTTVGEEGENDLYLDVKYRLLWFRLHHPNGKIDPELIRVDEKNAIVCCRIYADKADPADQFIGKAYSQRFSTEDRFGDRFLEIAETVAKGRALADAGYTNISGSLAP